MKSVTAILWGIVLALGVGVIVVFGILAPVLTRFVGQEAASSALPTILVVFAAAFAFYWGGMIAAYKAPSRRRLHGVLVGILAFAVSPLVNLGVGSLTGGGGDPVANFRTPGNLVVSVLLVLAVLVASYIGAVRGETLYAHNTTLLRNRRGKGTPPPS